MDDHDEIIPVESVEIASEGDVVHPVISAVMVAFEKNPTPETLQKILDMQRQWEADQARKAYTRSLAALQADLPSVIIRDQTVSYKSTRYTHVSLAKAVEAITEPLLKHGFVKHWDIKQGEKEIQVACVLTHHGGHSERTEMRSPVDTSGSKGPAQARASTVTLLSRYTLLAALGIATADMVEPTPDKGQRPKDVDQNRNLKAATAIRKKGLDIKEAEELVGRRAGQWTNEDLDKVREWLKSKSAPSRPEASVHDDEPPPEWKPSEGLFPDDDTPGPEGD